MTLDDLMPVLVAAFAVGGGVLAYWNQKRLDHRYELARQKREAYREFLTTMKVYERRAIRSGMPDADSPRRQAVEAYLAALANLQVFAPPRVFLASERANSSFRTYVDKIRLFYEKSAIERSDLDGARNIFERDFNTLIASMRAVLNSGLVDVASSNGSLEVKQ